MKRLVVFFIALMVGGLILFGQQPVAPTSKPKQQPKPQINLDAVKAQMMLRSNTRDKKVIIRDNMHRMQMARKKQAIVQRHQKMMLQKRKQVHRKKIQQQRVTQQRKLRQQAMRRRQIQRNRR